MTECLLVTDITLDGHHDAVRMRPTRACASGRRSARTACSSARSTPTAARPALRAPSPGCSARSSCRPPHLKDHYDRLWLTDRAAVRDTADLSGDGPMVHAGTARATSGTSTREGRLWIEGRLPHVIVAADGPVAPVGPEQQVERVAGVRRAAVVGVGPKGLRQAVAVVETTAPGVPPRSRRSRADPCRAREHASCPLVAVLAVPAPAHRHPAQLEDRPHAAVGVGGAHCSPADGSTAP